VRDRRRWGRIDPVGVTSGGAPRGVLPRRFHPIVRGRRHDGPMQGTGRHPYRRRQLGAVVVVALVVGLAVVAVRSVVDRPPAPAVPGSTLSGGTGPGSTVPASTASDGTVLGSTVPASTAPPTTAAAPVTSTTPTTGPGTLPQTATLPSPASSEFQAEMAALWGGVQTGSATPAEVAFFPAGAYVQLKSIGGARTDFEHRLLYDFGLDLRAAHAVVGVDGDPASATLVSVDVPMQYAHWVTPGVCDNSIGYFEVPNARV